MTENISSSHRGARQLRRRSAAVVVGVAVMLTPLVAAPAASARSSSVFGLLDEMLVTGYGGPGDGGPTNGLGPLLSAVLDGVSNLLKPNASTARVNARAKARLKTRH